MKLKVLDKGYIELVDTLGDDLTPVNAARVSFGGRSKTFEDKDRKLSKFLIKHKHFSPFRHQHCMFIIKAPEFNITLILSFMNQQSFVNNQKITSRQVMD